MNLLPYPQPHEARRISGPGQVIRRESATGRISDHRVAVPGILGRLSDLATVVATAPCLIVYNVAPFKPDQRTAPSKPFRMLAIRLSLHSTTCSEIAASRAVCGAAMNPRLMGTMARAFRVRGSSRRRLMMPRSV